ncbi:colicin transporter [Pseudomonas endophytica]|uniref:Colicin transporter n=1 Tax=Pseudomonas endophytica TaxID=1563157 RepID=A0A0Q0YZN1_9PSED|nr:bacteriocin immunity protein [Pseudomonas endophytica]KQB55249.1 colicin transporter [Pseudomonas endophytica]
MNKPFEDYTEIQFFEFMKEIFIANKESPDSVLDPLLDEFERVTGHPAGSDLIYWSKDESQCTPEGITKTVKECREANGLPGFKPRF